MASTTAGPAADVRAARAAEFGLDCTNELVWGGGTWSPGGEYPKKILLRNVSPDILVIKYKLPKSRYFHMEFPDPVKLSPGIQVALDIKFRPVQAEEYDDFVEVTVQNSGKSFRIPVVARLPRLAVKLAQSELSFGCCPVAEVSKATLRVENTGEVPAEFSWSVLAPFRVTPAQGIIPAGRGATFTFSFLPKQAVVMTSKAVLSVHKSAPQTLTLTGIAKFAFVTIDKPLLNYADTLIGTGGVATTKSVTLTNVSPVWTTWRLEHIDDDREPQFFAKPHEGLLRPGESCTVDVRYAPVTNGMHSTENFRISTPGGNSVNICATGTAKGPIVTVARKDRVGATTKGLNPLVCNFGDVKIGSTCMHAVTLHNHSNSTAFYQFQMEAGGVFKCSAVLGEVPALLDTNVAFTFVPEFVGNYYRRVYCLIRDGEPVYLDFVGTAYDDSQRPAPLKSRHVIAYRNRTPELKKLGPDELAAYVEAHGGREVDDDGNPLPSPQFEQEFGRKDLSKSGDVTRGGNAVASEFFQTPDEPTKEISVLQPFVDFGMGSRNRPPEKKSVVIKNRTTAKMTVTWQIPDSYDGDDDRDWQVIPPVKEIGPGKSETFSVAFMPSADDFYYSQELEAYATFKSNRSFRLVDDNALIPPWCLPVRVFGHTFPSTSQFLPKVTCNLPKLDPAGVNVQMYFPPCYLGESVYQTIQLSNPGGTPAFFQFFKDPTGVFEAKPMAGLIDAKGFQLVMIRFKPVYAREYKGQLALEINHSSDNCVKIHTIGYGSTPKLSLPLNANVCIKPTCLGVTSSRIYSIHNSSRIPLRCSFRIPQKFCEQLTVSPQSAVILGNNTLDVTWTFAPRLSEGYRIRVPCDVYPAVNEALGDTPAIPAVQRLYATVISEGTTGALVFDPPAVDFGSALVGSTTRVPLHLVNQSDCALSFKIEAVVEEELDGMDLDNDGIVEYHELKAYQARKAKAGVQSDANDESYDEGKGGDDDGIVVTARKPKATISFSPSHGSVPAHTKMTTYVAFVPPAAGKYVVRAFYEIHSLDDADALAKTGMRPPDVPESASRNLVTGLLGSTTVQVKDPLAPILPPPLNADPLWCEVRGIAGYPTLCFEDVRALSSSFGISRFLELSGLKDLMQSTRNASGVAKGSITGKLALGRLIGVDTKSRISQSTGVTAELSDIAPAGLFRRMSSTAILGNMRTKLTTEFAPWKLWEQFGLTDVNKFLSTPFTPEEIALNRQTRLTLDPEQLPTYSFEFTPATQGSSPSIVTFSLRNNTAIPASFEFIYPTTKEVAVEPWAEGDEDKSEHDFVGDLVEARVFGVHPRSGQLGAGESVNITMHYAYLVVATDAHPHELPVIFRISKGKQIRLMLRGKTLARGAPFAMVPHPLPDRIHRLAAVPIGILEPPVQSFPLYNPSQVDVKYWIDTEAIDALNAENYGFSVLDCLTTEGVIPPGEHVNISVVFQPLEVKEYCVKLNIGFQSVTGRRSPYQEEENAFEATFVQLVGRGYQPVEGTLLVDLPKILSPDVAEALGVVKKLTNAAKELACRVGVSGFDNSAGEALLAADAAAVEQANEVYGRVSSVLELPAEGGDPRSSPQFTFRPGEVPKGFVGCVPAVRRFVTFPVKKPPENLVETSLEWLRFGDIPQGSVTYRVTVLRNSHKKGPVEFAWDMNHWLVAKGLVKIHPKAGTILPDDVEVIRFAFAADCDPQVLEEDIGCMISLTKTEVQADTEAVLALLADKRAQLKAQSATVSLSKDPPRLSVAARSTQARLANLEATATERMLKGKKVFSGTVKAIQEGHEVAGVMESLATAALAPPNPEGLAESEEALVAAAFADMGLETPIQGNSGNASPSKARGGRGSQASMRSKTSRLTMSTRGTQGNAPSIDMPPVPRTVVFVHVSARVCGLPEFRDAHGPDAVKAFAAVTPGSGNKSSIRVHPGVASSALLASVSSGPSGSVAAETVLADVMDALLADLVRDGDVDDTFDGLTQPKIPLFSTLTGGPSAATLTSSGDAEQRNSVLADTDGQELLAKLLENTVLNLVREAVHGEFDPTALPVTIVRRK